MGIHVSDPKSLLPKGRAWAVLIVLGAAACIYACVDEAGTLTYEDPPSPSELPADIAVKWADMTWYQLRFSAFNTPTYASRSLGYLGLTMYESIVTGSDQHRSLSGQLNGLTLPSAEAGAAYHWTLSLNAGQRKLLKLLYPVPGNSHIFIHERIDSLYDAIFEAESMRIDPAVVKRSVQFGESIAEVIYNWSVSDGGDKGYQRNFDNTMTFPFGDSYWVPPIRGQTVSLFPLHHKWGSNRTFIAANGQLPVPPILPFSTDPSSEYYKKYNAVYENDPTLTQEEMEIAAWWADDPTETASPPGHSYYLATLAVKNAHVDMVTAAEAHARVGMAVADAFINCWKAKYTYYNERPSSYIKKYIDPEFVQFWPEPPFPAFPSGHSIQAASAAEVLTDVFGESFSFTDDVYEGHRRYDDIRFFGLKFPARSYTSFWQAANECAYSRFLGGIHTQQDNDTGIQEGKKIGANVNALNWRK